MKIRKSQIESLKLNDILTDEQLCEEYGLAIPEIPADRLAATKVINNFQIKKSFLVSSINKQLAPRGTQLSQYKHTNYKVIPTATKVAKVKAQIARLENSLLG